MAFLKRLILTMLVVAAACSATYLLLRDVMIDNIRVIAAAVMDIEQENQERQYREWRKDLKILSRSHFSRLILNKSALRTSIRGDRLKVEERFQSFIRHRADFIESIRLIDSRGRERVIVTPKGPVRSYVRVRDQSFFRRAMRLRPGETIGTLSKNTLGDPVLNYSIKMITNSGETGVMDLTVRLDSVIGNMNKAGVDLAFTHAYLFNNNNHLVYHKPLKVAESRKSTDEVIEVYRQGRNTGSPKMVFEDNGAFWGYFESKQLGIVILFEMESAFLNDRVLQKFQPFAILITIMSLLILLIKRPKKLVRRKGGLVLAQGVARKNREEQGDGEQQVVRVRDLAHIANQLRVPLNNVISTLGLLSMSELGHKQRDNVSHATRNSEWMLEILNVITDFSALKKGRFRLENAEFNLREVIADASELLEPEAYKKGIEVFHVINYDVPDRLQGDATRLRQILVNLIANAIKSSEQGDISLHVNVTRRRKDDVFVRIEVNESGVGAETEFAFTVFEEFDRNEPLPSLDDNRNMLGISISKQLIELMGGKIGVMDNATGGSVFWLELPFTVLEDASKPKTDTGLKGRRLFVLGEKEFNRKAVSALLSSWGISCDSGGDYEKTCQALERSVELGHVYDALLIDISAENGFQQALALQEKMKSSSSLADIPVTIMTSKEDSTDAQMARAAGMAAYLGKPVNRTQLRNALEQSILHHVPGEERETIIETIGITGIELHDDTLHLSRKILLVESNVPYQRLLSGFIERSGLQPVVAESVPDAIRAIDRESYAMVLLDADLPEQMALDVCRKIRRREKRIVHKSSTGEERAFRTPIILIADELKSSVQERYFTAGIDDILHKPINIEDIVNLVEGWELPAIPGNSSSQLG